MLDAFAKVVSQADAKGEFLSSRAIGCSDNIVKDGNKRLDAVNRITSNASTIVD
jgi:phycocyanin beta chain